LALFQSVNQPFSRPNWGDDGGKTPALIM